MALMACAQVPYFVAESADVLVDLAGQHESVVSVSQNLILSVIFTGVIIGFEPFPPNCGKLIDLLLFLKIQSQNAEAR